MKRLMLLLVMAIGLTACGGGGGDGGGSSAGTPTPQGTSVNLAPLKSVFLGTSTGAQYSFPALFGSDSLGRAWSGSYTIVADGSTTFEGLNVSKQRSLVTLQMAGTAPVSGVTTSYYQVADGSPYKSFSSNGVTYVSTSSVPMPASAKVGDFGSLGTSTGSDGTTSSATWALNADVNGASRLVISSTIKTGLTVTASETDTYFLDATGTPTALAASVTTSGVTVNLSGARN